MEFGSHGPSEKFSKLIDSRKLNITDKARFLLNKFFSLTSHKNILLSKSPIFMYFLDPV